MSSMNPIDKSMESVIKQPLKEYDASIFTEENQANTYLCTICQFICHDVVSVECGNGHIFCRGCMEQYVKHSNQCPNCQKPITSIHDAKFVDRLIQSLQVKCISNISSYISPYSSKGIQSECQWIGALREVDKHYQTQCEYTILKCKKCGQSDILRKDSSTHLKNKCPFTMIECPNKNQGCNSKMQRRKLQDHLDKYCSFRSLHCPYTKHGCLFTKKNGKLAMKELQTHLTDSQYRILHLELQLHSLTKQMEKTNLNHKSLHFNHHKDNKIHLGNDYYLYQQKSLSNSSNCNLLFAYIGSDEGKYAEKNCILCIDIQRGVSQTIFDPLSIALINNNHNTMKHTQYISLNQLNDDFNNYANINGTIDYYHPALKKAYSEKTYSMNNAFHISHPHQSIVNINQIDDNNHHNHHTINMNRNWDIRNHGACVANNTNINNQKCTVLFRVGGWNSNDEQEIALPHVDGYIVEHNQWLHNLPDLPSCSSGCGCVYSSNYGLMVVGGESPQVTDTLYQLPFGINTNHKRKNDNDNDNVNDNVNVNDNDLDEAGVEGEDDEKKENGQSNIKKKHNHLKWKKLKPMKRARTNLALSSFVDGKKEYIFVCGGYNDGESLKWCELYNFESNQWQDLPKSMYRHQSAGCCYWPNGNGTNQNSMIVIGGYPEAKLVEEYSFYKNKWYKLPSTQHNHQFLPSIWVYTDPKINPNGCGILLCAGNRCNLKPLNDRTATGYIEFFDKRESIQKWHTLYSLRDMIYFGLHCKIINEDDGRRVRRIFR